MRGLNLSRLASRGKASEGSYFKDQQALQAANLRKQLSADEISHLKSGAAARNGADASVDMLSSISGHTAYRQIVQTSARDSIATASASAPGVLQRVRQSANAPYVDAARKARDAHVDASIMRVLGSGKLNVYSSMVEEKRRAGNVAVRALPGSSRYADGAVLGLASFSIASAVVASVGLVGGMYVYFNPSVVDRMRQRTSGFGQRIDSTLGERMRSFSQQMTGYGPLLTDETTQKAREFASQAIGFSSAQSSDQVEANDGQR